MIASQMARRPIGFARCWITGHCHPVASGCSGSISDWLSLQAMGSIVVALGLVWSGLKDAFSGNDTSPSDQLLMLYWLPVPTRLRNGNTGPSGVDIGRLFEERTALGVNSAIDKIRSLQVHRALRADAETNRKRG